MRTWPLQEARAHLRDVVDNALTEGPQRITRHGKQAVIVVSEEEWERRPGSGRSFGELLVSCPASADDLPSHRPARVIRRRMFD